MRGRSKTDCSSRSPIDHLVIRLQVAEELLDSALVGLVGIDSRGRMAWQNAAARSLLGVSSSDDADQHGIEASLGLSVSQLASLPPIGAAMLTLPNGLLVWARAEMQSPDGLRNLVAGSPALASPEAKSVEAVPEISPSHSGSAAESEPLAAAALDPDSMRESPSAGTAATLRESDRELINRTLRSCGGNVSEAARALGVSRNLIYRRLRVANPKALPARA